MKLSFWIILFSLIFYTIPLFAQNPYYTKKIPTEQLQADFQQYKQVLEAIHPSLDWYTTKEELKRAFDQVAVQLNSPKTEQEFYQLLAPLSAMINCGHTGTIPSAKTRSSINNRIPLEFRYVEGKLYVFYDYQTKDYPCKEVSSINGRSIATLLKELSSLNGTDGYIQTPKPLFFNNSGSFGYRYHLFYNDSTYTITYQDGSQISRSAISADSLNSISQLFYPKKDLLNYQIKAEEKWALLSINSFDKSLLKQASWKYKKYLDDFFKKIKSASVDYLIIDLRNNGGGEDNYASLLYSYLSDEPFVYYQKMGLNPVPQVKSVADQVFLPSEVKNGLIRSFFIKKKEGEYFVKPTYRTKGLRKQKSQKNHFEGTVYLLISGATYSAAAEITAYAKAHRPKTYFIGQETGGAMQGNTSAIFAYQVLKNSGLASYIPLVRYTMNVTEFEKGRGVLPDYKMENSLNSIKEDKDDLLDFTIKLCMEKQ